MKYDASIQLYSDNTVSLITEQYKFPLAEQEMIMETIIKQCELYADSKEGYTFQSH